jgi:hypothetical protein
MSKKKAVTNQKKGNKQQGADDDDWEAILEAEKAANAVLSTPPPAVPEFVASDKLPTSGASKPVNATKKSAEDEGEEDDESDEEGEDLGKKDKVGWFAVVFVLFIPVQRIKKRRKRKQKRIRKK